MLHLRSFVVEAHILHTKINTDHAAQSPIEVSLLFVDCARAFVRLQCEILFPYKQITAMVSPGQAVLTALVNVELQFCIQQTPKVQAMYTHPRMLDTTEDEDHTCVLSAFLCALTIRTTIWCSLGMVECLKFAFFVRGRMREGWSLLQCISTLRLYLKQCTALLAHWTVGSSQLLTTTRFSSCLTSPFNY